MPERQCRWRDNCGQCDPHLLRKAAGIWSDVTTWGLWPAAMFNTSHTFARMFIDAASDLWFAGGTGGRRAQGLTTTDFSETIYDVARSGSNLYGLGLLQLYRREGNAWQTLQVIGGNGLYQRLIAGSPEHFLAIGPSARLATIDAGTGASTEISPTSQSLTASCTNGAFHEGRYYLTCGAVYRVDGASVAATPNSPAGPLKLVSGGDGLLYGDTGTFDGTVWTSYVNAPPKPLVDFVYHDSHLYALGSSLGLTDLYRRDGDDWTTLVLNDTTPWQRLWFAADGTLRVVAGEFTTTWNMRTAVYDSGSFLLEVFLANRTHTALCSFPNGDTILGTNGGFLFFDGETYSLMPESSEFVPFTRLGNLTCFEDGTAVVVGYGMSVWDGAAWTSGTAPIDGDALVAIGQNLESVLLAGRNGTIVANQPACE